MIDLLFPLRISEGCRGVARLGNVGVLLENEGYNL